MFSPARFTLDLRASRGKLLSIALATVLLVTVSVTSFRARAAEIAVEQGWAAQPGV